MLVGRKPGNYICIQEAINNASKGDTIFIYNGTYYENVIVNKTVNIILVKTKETTIINGFINNGNETFFCCFLCNSKPGKKSNITVTNNNYKQDLQQYNNTGFGIIIKANNTSIIRKRNKRKYHKDCIRKSF